MYVTSAEQRAGIFVAVITGGRPTLNQRPVAHLLPALADAGVHSIGWVMSDQHAPEYETDAFEQVIYTRDWAEEYAATHWMLPTRPEPGGFLGAFPGREWACREAERRGCWAVLQLDDNIKRIDFVRSVKSGVEVARRHGGLGLFVDLLAGVLLSTNARTAGAQLSSVNPADDLKKMVRPGFPYSLFLEQVGEGREPWYGPFEDDITHSFQYGTRADGATAAVMPVIHYQKETTSKTGMRQQYNHTRSVQLQRIFPESAKIGVQASRSNGLGGARMFHKMTRSAIRNRLVIRDRAMFGAIKTKVRKLAEEFHELNTEATRDKIMRRADRGGADSE